MKQVDVVVVGSGAGGMVAALAAKKAGLRVLLIEKSRYYGGSTAMSGGGIWVPGNPVLRRAGVKDSLSETVAYLKQVTAGEVPEEKLVAYATAGPEMIEFLETLSPTMQFIYSKGYSDYHPEFTYGHPEGRSIEAKPFNTRLLGTHKREMQSSNIVPPMGMWLTAGDFQKMSMMMRTWRGRKATVVIGLRTVANYFTGRSMVALGLSLIGRLRKTMIEQDIDIQLETSLEDLIIEKGRVVGVKTMHRTASEEVRATRGVILAMGGFDHNQALRESYLPPAGRQDASAGSPSNVGDGIQIAMHRGLKLELMDDAWWMPSVRLPDGKLFTLVSERAIPRSIIVGQDGRRFTNEASPYVNFVHDQLAAGFDHAWQIVDKKALGRYMYAAHPPMMPLPKSWFTSGMAVKARTIDELAAAIQVPADTLRQTLRNYNAMVPSGVDSEFHRGDSAYDRYYGDPALKNPVLDYLDTPPYYAFRVLPGDIGTKGGIATDERARALRTDGTVVEGLYATGNVSASVMGRDYAGVGATIGPSMVFGYVAAQDIAAHGQNEDATNRSKGR
jgi:3-oxosteroid 1-dehydrogenase